MQKNIISRYQLLQKASQPNSEIDYELQQQLSKLDDFINKDLIGLSRQGAPDNITDILRGFDAELTRFRQFCEFPSLATKSIVGIGGGFSAGKSSFINKLIGQKCLTVEVDPTTSMPAYVLRGEAEQALIRALNIHDCAIDLSQEEFASLTHEEKEIYGFQVALLLKAAFVSLPDFQWRNLAILDTPGYSKPEDETWPERTDANLAREQLNTANYIVWVVSAENGTIPEADIQFLSSLKKEIPKLVVLSKADKKTASDIANICQLVQSTLVNRGIQVIEVVPYSHRSKSEFSLDKIINQFEIWNKEPKPLQFAQNFRRQFTSFKNFITESKQNALVRLNHANKILALSEDIQITESANSFLVKEKQELALQTQLLDSLNQLTDQFFSQLKLSGDIAGIDLTTTEQQELAEKYSNQLINILKKQIAVRFGVTDLEKTYPKQSLDFLLFTETGDELSLNKHLECMKHLSEQDKELFLEILVAVISSGIQLTPPQQVFVKHLFGLTNTTSSLNELNLDINESKLEKFISQLKINQELLESFIGLSLAASWFKGAWFESKVFESCQYLTLAVTKEVKAFTEKDFDLAWQFIISSPALAKEAQTKLVKSHSWTIRELLAINPAVTLEVQTILAKDEDLKIRQLLAESKSVRIEIQGILAKDDAVLSTLAKNPVLSMEIQHQLMNCEKPPFYALAENSSLTDTNQKIIYEYNDGSYRSTLATNLSLIPELQELLANDEDKYTRRYLAENLSLTLNAQQILVDDSEEYNRRCLAKNPSIHLSIQSKLAQDHKKYVRQELAENTALEISVQNILAYDPEESVRRYLAQNLSIQPSVQQTLAKDSEDYVRRTLAENKLLTFDAQTLLSQDNSDSVRSSLAENKSLNRQIQYILLQDESWRVKQSLANNLVVNANIYQILSTDEDLDVRVALAKNPLISSDIQLCLANDSKSRVREYLAENGSIIESVQHILANDKDSLVLGKLYNNKFLNSNIKKQLKKNVFDKQHTQEDALLYSQIHLQNQHPIPSNIQKIILDNYSWQSVKLLAMNPSLTIDYQSLLAKKREEWSEDWDWSTLEQVAKNPSLAPEIQRFLASLNDENLMGISANDMQAALAENPSITIDVQTKLFSYGAMFNPVREHLAKNLSVALETQRILLKEVSLFDSVREYLAKNPSIALEIQQELAKGSWINDVREHLALNPSITLEVQQMLLEDEWDYEDEAIKIALAQNSSIAIEIQKQLIETGSYEVRKALAKNPSVNFNFVEIMAPHLDVFNSM
ncbi:MAG: signal recognition particle receptor subunit beta [Cocleimonas sp.]|jgi:signal recognition particle receptor subunit beta